MKLFHKSYFPANIIGAKIPNINQNQQKRRVKVSDDIQIIIKKFRDNSEGW